MKMSAICTAVLSGLLLLCGCGSKPSQSAVPGGTPSTVSPPAAGSGATVGTATSWTAANIDQYLAHKPAASTPSPLVGQGAMFETYGEQFTVDPRLIVAITAAETSYASGKCHSTPVVSTHNAWNWFWCEANDSCGDDVCVHSPFDTWGSGIETVSHFMRSTYLNKGYTNVKLIASKYCTAGCANWVPNVTKSMQEMNGDPENLTLNVGH
jgi:hypothetical protein